MGENYRRVVKRNLIWNNDGSDLLAAAYGSGGWPCPYESVDQYIDSLLRFIENTKVSSIFYNGCTNEPVWEVAQRGDRVSDNIAVLGALPEKHVLDFARKNNMEFFYSIRMNDIHASYFPPKLSYWPPFRLSNPELLLGYTDKKEFEDKFLPWINRFLEIDKEYVLTGKKMSYEFQQEINKSAMSSHPLSDVMRRIGNPSRDLWFWASYDYAKKAVRERYYSIIEGACKNFDLDGIELDWCRMAVLFKEGEERQNTPIMNDFIHSIHLCLKKYGKKRGRPILLAMKLPDSIEKCKAAGLDPETWAEEGWMDLIMAGTGQMPFTMPIDEWISLGKKYDIPVYGCLDRKEHIFRSGKPKWESRFPDVEIDDMDYTGARGAASRFWERGADGIYLYDWHTHHGPTIPEDYGFLPDIDDPQKLKGKNKLFQIEPSTLNGAHLPARIPGQLPLYIDTEDHAAKIRLKIDLADVSDNISKICLQMKWSRQIGIADLNVCFNGAPLSDPRKLPEHIIDKAMFKSIPDAPKGEWIEFDIPVFCAKGGGNEISMIVGKGCGYIKLEQVCVLILY